MDATNKRLLSCRPCFHSSPFLICIVETEQPFCFRFARDVDEDCMVNGQFLPKGATLEIPAGYLHYDPEYWPEPEKFIPDR